MSLNSSLNWIQIWMSQIEWVSMGSSFGLTLANIFLCYHESNWLNNCAKDFKLDLKTTSASKILFLKHHSQVWFINFYTEAAHPPTLVRSTDISK